MKYLTYIIFFVTCTFLTTSCGSDDGTGCKEFGSGAYHLNISEQFVTLPGKVSVFFKVDTRTGLPVSNLTSDDFKVYEKGRNDECFNEISAFEANAHVSPNTQVFGSNTMLVLDLSGSVVEGSFQELKEAAISFIEQIMPATDDPAYQMGIWWFDGEDLLHPLSNFISDRQQLINMITALDQSMTTDPSTDLYGAVIKATDIANDIVNVLISDKTIATASVVLFTDGTDQAARHTREAAITAVNDANPNISYFTIGLGNEIDRNILAEIGKTAAIIAENKTELEAKFLEASMLVFDEANSFYLFEYCSPKRDGSGINELAIELNYEGQRGSVLTEFDATGFNAGCQ